jgi:hypothetical protein
MPLRLSSFLLILLAGLLVGACKTETPPEPAEPEPFTVDFLAPEATQAVDRADSLHFQIRVTVNEGEMHGVKVLLYPADAPQNRIIDFWIHVHDESYLFETTRDLAAFPAGTRFVLASAGCPALDHACELAELKTIEFWLPKLDFSQKKSLMDA